MKIAIIGTRGIPNYHGGFEQFAEHFSIYLYQNNHEVTVYNSSNHPYQEKNYKGVNIKHCKDPENKIGTFGQFIYDFNCIINTRKQNFDVILQLGYTSNSIWHKFLPKKAIIITNMDGLEWKRSKYSKITKYFLKVAEKWAVKSSHYLISDSKGIQKYLNNTYQKSSTLIAYGANLFTNPDDRILLNYGVKPHSYNMLIARIEPENNIETILDGVVLSNKKQPFLVIGKNQENKFGKRLTKKYKNINNIIFLGGIYNQNHLNNLRYFSNLYFHGHSVGGTNPSLIEAMSSKALIIAHDNMFNKDILKKSGYYFTSSKDVKQILENKNKKNESTKINNNLEIINKSFRFDIINQKYLTLIEDSLK